MMSMMNSMSRPTLFGVATAALVAVFIVLRLTGLEVWPDGFYIDEGGEAGNFVCLGKTGTSYYGEDMPLYTTGPGGGKLSPVFIYGEALWTRAFGPSITGIRTFVALWNLLGLVGLYCLGRLLAGPRAGWLAALIGAMCPWALINARVAWDQSLEITPLIWGTYFLLRARDRRDYVAAAALLTIATYCYQAMRVQVVVLSVALLAALWRRRSLTWGRLLIFGATAVLLAVPQILFVLSPEGYGRFSYISLFAKNYVAENAHGSMLKLLGNFLDNLRLHLSPPFLFVAGDSNLRHSIAGFGQLGYLEALAAVVALPLAAWWWWRRRRDLASLPVLGTGAYSAAAGFGICIAGIFSGVLPASLTWDSLPHGLRSAGSWPFFVLTAALVLTAWLSVQRRTAAVAVVVVGLAFTVCFVRKLPFIREQSRSWFDAGVVELARSAKDEHDWREFAQRYNYYARDALAFQMMAYGPYDCKGAEAALGAFLDAK
jgi:hypothetical protein